MSPKLQAILKSYARGVVTACVPLISLGNSEPKAYLMAVVAGVIAPALRGLDKNDPSFGLVADALVAETTKVTKATKTK